MAEEPEKKKDSRKIIAAVLISAAVLGGAGYGVYQATASQPQKQSTSVKKSKPAASKDLFKSPTQKGKKSKKQAKKQQQVVNDVLGSAFPASVLKTITGSGDGADNGVSGVLLDDGLGKLASTLDSDQTQGLVALANEAVNPPAPATTPATDATTPVELSTGNGTGSGLSTGTGNDVGTKTGTETDTETGTTTGTGTKTDTGTGTGTGTETGDNGGGGTTTTDAAPVLSVPSTLIVHKGQASVNLMTGVSASDSEDGDLTSKVTYSTTLDKNTPGDYTATYSVTGSAGHTASVTRTITVVNDAPSIAWVNGNRVEVGGHFDPMQSVYAADFQDGILTSMVAVTGSVDTTTPGDYQLQYSVTDSDGQKTTRDRTVTVYADAPALDTGSVQTSVPVGTTFDPMSGVRATSKYGDATVKVDGSVDTTKPGANQLTYTATDKYGQSMTKAVTVNVTADKPALDVSKVKTGLKVGDTFDANADVTATSPYGDAKVTVEGTVDTSKAGDYKLTYTATDKFGQTSSQDVTVTVAAPVAATTD